MNALFPNIASYGRFRKVATSHTKILFILTILGTFFCWSSLLLNRTSNALCSVLDFEDLVPEVAALNLKISANPTVSLTKAWLKAEAGKKVL